MRAKSSPSFLVSQGPAILEKKRPFSGFLAHFLGILIHFKRKCCVRKVYYCAFCCVGASPFPLCGPMNPAFLLPPGLPATLWPSCRVTHLHPKQMERGRRGWGWWGDAGWTGGPGNDMLGTVSPSRPLRPPPPPPLNFLCLALLPCHPWAF